MIDWDFLLDQEKAFWPRFRDAFDTGFSAKVPVGCLCGDRGQINCGAFGLPARLLDLAKRHPEFALQIRWAVARMTVHFARDHCFQLVDGSVYSPGETVQEHPVRREQFDGDLGRHQDFEWLSRIEEFRDEAESLGYSRDEHTELCGRIAYRLYRATDPMRLRDVDFLCEGAHGRLKVAGNLAWLYSVVGDERLIDHADLCVLAALHETKRALPTGGHAWAGSHEFEVGRKNTQGIWTWKGNPRADHNSASGWHVGDVTRFLTAVFLKSRKQMVRDFCADWARTWADQAFQENGILRFSDQGARVCSVSNWVHDNLYHEQRLLGPDGASMWRRYYPYHKNPAEPGAPAGAFFGPQLDWEQAYGWSGLFQIAYALTGQRRYQSAAETCLRDALFWPHKAGALTICREEEKKLDWYGPQSNWSGAGRNVSWRLTASWAMPMGEE